MPKFYIQVVRPAFLRQIIKVTAESQQDAEAEALKRAERLRLDRFKQWDVYKPIVECALLHERHEDLPPTGEGDSVLVGSFSEVAEHSDVYCYGLLRAHTDHVEGKVVVTSELRAQLSHLVMADVASDWHRDCDTINEAEVEAAADELATKHGFEPGDLRREIGAQTVRDMARIVRPTSPAPEEGQFH